MTFLAIGRSKDYCTKKPQKDLTDTELLAKEKRVAETNKKKENSKLYSIWCSVKDFFIAPEFINSYEQDRLQTLHSSTNSTNQVNSVQRNQQQQSIWTQEKKKP